MIPHPSQAAASRVSHQDTAHHPCSRVPSIPGLVDPEEVGVPVEVDLQVSGRHPLESPRIAPEPGAQVVHHLHLLQVVRVVDVGPVRLALEPAVPNQRVVRPLEVVDQQRPGAILPPMASLTRAQLGFPWPQTTATGFLCTSMATQIQSFWRDRPRFLACP